MDAYKMYTHTHTFVGITYMYVISSAVKSNVLLRVTSLLKCCHTQYVIGSKKRGHFSLGQNVCFYLCITSSRLHVIATGLKPGVVVL